MFQQVHCPTITLQGQQVISCYHYILDTIKLTLIKILYDHYIQPRLRVAISTTNNNTCTTPTDPKQDTRTIPNIYPVHYIIIIYENNPKQEPPSIPPSTPQPNPKQEPPSIPPSTPHPQCTHTLTYMLHCNLPTANSCACSPSSPTSRLMPTSRPLTTCRTRRSSATVEAFLFHQHRCIPMMHACPKHPKGWRTLERFFSFGAFLQFSDLIEKEKSRGSAERHAFLILRLREGESGRGTERRRRKIARTREGGTGSLGADEGMGQTVQNAVRRFVWGWCVSPCLFFVVAVSLHLDRPVSGQRHWDREKNQNLRSKASGRRPLRGHRDRK